MKDHLFAIFFLQDDSLEPVLLYGDLMRICGVTAENILFRISALDDDKPWRRTPKFVRNITPAEQKRNNDRSTGTWYDLRTLKKLKLQAKEKINETKQKLFA